MFFNIKANMDIMYKDTISAQIHGEEWTIIMIFIWWKHVFIIRYLYHMTYQYQIFYIILSSQPLYHKCIFFIVPLALSFFEYE